MSASLLPDPPHPLMKYLWPLGPDSPSELRVGAVVAAYAESTGVLPSNPLTADDRRKIAQWLYDEDERMPHNELGQFLSLTRIQWTSFVPLVHRDLSSKLAYLQQRRCDVCDSLELTPLSVAFAVNIRPFSAQAIKSQKRLTQIKKRIRDHLASRPQIHVPGWAGYPLCVNLVALQGGGDRLKDVDNVSKGLLDAMQDVLYENDNKIQHLTTQRVIHRGPEAFYLVRILPVRINQSDVFELSLPPGWLAGQEQIDISDI